MNKIDPGHVYELGNHLPEIAENAVPQTLRFVKKELVDGKLVTVMNGTSTEQVIDTLIDRLSYLYEKLPDPYTKTARIFLGQAANALQERTKDRKERAVEGTHEK